MTSATLTAGTSTLTGNYVIDSSHSRIGFIARHAMITKVRGGFNTFDGTAHLDFEHPVNSSVSVTIDVASVDTRNAQRDDHLRTNDFFNATDFPQITFASTSVKQVDAENYKVTGDLTIKGVTKAITVDYEYTGTAKDLYGNTRVGFEGTATLNRSDFGVNFNAALETGGVIVSEKINLEFEISAVKVESA
jgi:polyisoprenoid-binding protein YceI